MTENVTLQLIFTMLLLKVLSVEAFGLNIITK